MTDPTDHTKSLQFKVALVEKTKPNDGNNEPDWHRYVLENGRSTIEGQRRGTLKDVTTYATQYIEQLNARSSMAQSTWSPRGRKPAEAAKAKNTTKS